MSSQPPPLGPPPAGGDVDRGPGLAAFYWVLSAVAVTLISLRLYARICIRAVGWDDWMMLVTVLLFVILTCFVTYFASIGGARHVYYLTPQQQLDAVKWSWISQPWGIFLFATGKTSVALLILRLMGPQGPWRKWLLYGVIVSVFIVNSLGCIFTFVQCNPPRALWTPGLPATCWDPSVQGNYNYFLTAWNILLDVILAVLPITIFWNLHMKLSQKILLCSLLSLGFVDGLFSGIKILYLTDLQQRADFTWSAYSIEMWTGAEAFVMILVGNIPPLKILWDRWHGKQVGSRATPLKGSNSAGSSFKPSSGPKSFFSTSVSAQRLGSRDTNGPGPGEITSQTEVEISSMPARPVRSMV